MGLSKFISGASLIACLIFSTQANAQCENVLDSARFEKLLVEVQKHDFDDGKLQSIEQVGNGSCYQVEQVIQLLGQFSFEEDRISLIKVLWTRIKDKSRLEEILAVFEFESSKKEVRKFIAEFK